MKKTWLILWLTLFIYGGCAPAGHKPQVVWQTDSTEKAWKLRIGSPENVRLSGLLLISRNDNLARIVILDSSGITLCSWCQDQTGEISRIQGIMPAIRQGLPKYMSTALIKIFGVMENTGCEWSGLSRLCLIGPSQHKKKECRLGPVPLWQVDYWYETEEQDFWHKARLNGLVTGPEVLIEAIN